ncbi:hypothetical protein ABZ943_24840, partial [Streptomyces rubiginosohelvolus]
MDTGHVVARLGGAGGGDGGVHAARHRGEDTHLAAPNGISFDEEYRGLWFSELTENRISYLRL